MLLYFYSSLFRLLDKSAIFVLRYINSKIFMTKLSRRFFVNDALTAAKAMLGKYIVRIEGKRKIAGKIVETEAYIGPQDRASHAYKGKRTKRNEIEYLIGGHVYIYLVYGMYWQLNIITGPKNSPECVLIRALEPVDAKGKNLANGPGKLCRYLKVDKSFYGVDVCRSGKLWLEDSGIRIRKSEIISASRVGIDYAGSYWSRRKWRFYIKDNPYVSKS